MYFSSEECDQECIDQKEIGHKIWATQGRNREVKIISSSLLPSADSFHSLVCTTLVTPDSLGSAPRGWPQAQKLNHRHKYFTKKVFLSEGFLLTCVGAGLNCNKECTATESFILILQDAQQSRRCMKPEKAVKVNSSFSKHNWKKSVGHNKASVTV